MNILLRKSIRLLAALFPIAYLASGKEAALLICGAVLCASALLEGARAASPFFNARIFSRIGAVLKGKERRRPLASTIVTLSCFLAILLFDETVAVNAMCFLIFGDAASAVAGMKLGRRGATGRTPAGSAAFFVACACIVAALRFTRAGLPYNIGLAGAAAAMLVELAPRIDDNLTIALFSGAVMSYLKTL